MKASFSALFLAIKFFLKITLQTDLIIASKKIRRIEKMIYCDLEKDETKFQMKKNCQFCTD